MLGTSPAWELENGLDSPRFPFGVVSPSIGETVWPPSGAESTGKACNLMRRSTGLAFELTEELKSRKDSKL